MRRAPDSAIDFRDRARKITPSFYQQITGVVQSLTAGFLILAVGNSTSLWPLDGGTLTTWLLFVADFQLIVLTWHVNVQHSAIFFRLPGISDSYIPFLFLIPECMLIQHSYSEHLFQWLVTFSAFCSLTCVAYTDMYSRARRESENDFVFLRIGSFTVWIRAYVLGGGSLFFALAYLFPSSSYGRLATAVVANFAILLFMVLHDRFYWARVTSLQVENSAAVNETD